MEIFHKEQDKKTFDVSIKIKAYKPISEQDKERINKAVLLLDSLGHKEDTTEKLYRFTSERDDELLIDVDILEDTTPSQKHSTNRFDDLDKS